MAVSIVSEETIGAAFSLSGTIPQRGVIDNKNACIARGEQDGYSPHSVCRISRKVRQIYRCVRRIGERVAGQSKPAAVRSVQRFR